MQAPPDANRWLSAWSEGRIAFHQATVTPPLQKHLACLGAPGRIAVPLCGKTIDLPFLAELGWQAAGFEFVPRAIAEFHQEQSRRPRVSRRGPYRVHESQGIEIFEGDFFAAGDADLPLMDAAWDRASLVAVDPPRRAEYMRVLRQILRPGAPVLLVAFEYDPAEMPGPPFSVTRAEVARLYEGWGQEMLDSADQINELPTFRARGLSAFLEHTWLLHTPGG